MALSPTAYWRGLVDGQLHDHERDISDLRIKVGGLEKFMWKLMGAAVVGSILGGAIVTIISYLIVGTIQHH